MASDVTRLMMKRVAMIVVGVAALSMLVWTAGTIGAARSIAHFARATSRVVEADRATSWSPSDAGVHLARAFVMQEKGQTNESAASFERAVVLRPRDYYAWLELGRARDLLGDEAGAVVAFQQSVSLAPSYSKPRWLLGNLLFRVGQRERAFNELRVAALNDQYLLPGLIDLAWFGSSGDAKFVENLVRPSNSIEHAALARFYVRNNREAEAIDHIRRAGKMSPRDFRDVLWNAMNRRKHRAAFEVWRIENDRAGDLSGVESFIDGSIEGRISFNDLTFGWRIPKLNGVTVSLDSVGTKAGDRCLRIDYNGHSNPGESIVSQMILVEPSCRYQIHFFARTKELKTGGVPILTVRDVTIGDHSLMNPAEISNEGETWREYLAEFATTEATTSILVSLQRKDCVTLPCPVFGGLWLDQFELKRIR